MRCMVAGSVFLSLAVVSGCGSNDAAKPASGDGDVKEALVLASDACSEALEMDLDMDVAVLTRQGAADKAARAARLDDSWDGLLDATSDWAFRTQAVVEEGLDDLSYARVTEMRNDLDDLKSAVSRECRKVVAAGGDVDPDLLAGF